MEVISMIRGGFMLSAFAIIAIFCIGPLGSRFLQYGPRSVPDSNSQTKGQRSTPTTSSFATQLLDFASTWRIPRSWFAQFYAYSIAASLFWGHQILTKGPYFDYVARRTESNDKASMSSEQAVLVWSLLVFQGSRRLLESYAFSKPTTSSLWIVHWVMGLGFYTALNIAIWIEAIPSLQKNPIDHQVISRVPRVAAARFLELGMFFFASQMQFFAHQHLASLPSAPNYKVPNHRLFQRCLTPHYLAECLIYLSLALIAAPPGQYVNCTLLYVMMFVTVNLGVTAHETRQWYVKRFGENAVRERYRMIPKIW